MKKDRTCPHCHEEFKQIDGRVFSNHVRWCKLNPDKDRLSGKIFKEKLAKKNNELTDRRNGRIKRFKVKCFTCGNDFYVEEREKLFPQKERYFCSLECGHKYAASCTDPKKISEGVIRRLQEQGYVHVYKERKRIYRRKELVEKICPCCENTFTTKNEHKECCSQSCAASLRYARSYELKIANASEWEKEKLRLVRYRQLCQFKFSLNQFPDEFDFKLIEEHGWYSAPNRGNNPNGVSRDHMYSVKQGFLNGVDPKIISHPANCKLVLQSENFSKRDGCSITLEELMKRIEEWDKKYGTQTEYN